jgi:hypothetical protein
LSLYLSPSLTCHSIWHSPETELQLISKEQPLGFCPHITQVITVISPDSFFGTSSKAFPPSPLSGARYKKRPHKDFEEDCEEYWEDGDGTPQSPSTKRRKHLASHSQTLSPPSSPILPRATSVETGLRPLFSYSTVFPVLPTSPLVTGYALFLLPAMQIFVTLPLRCLMIIRVAFEIILRSLKRGVAGSRDLS